MAFRFGGCRGGLRMSTGGGCCVWSHARQLRPHQRAPCGGGESAPGVGLQWLRKAILRATGYRPKHDEDAIYHREVERLSGPPRTQSGRDAIGFTISFKGVLLEGMEIVMIVLTLGLSSGHLLVASSAALAAVILVAAVGVLVSRQLREVPENAMKLAVGLMLVSFGSFWGGQGAGVSWPGGDLSLLGLLAGYAVVTWLAIRFLGQAGSGPVQVVG